MSICNIEKKEKGKEKEKGELKKKTGGLFKEIFFDDFEKNPTKRVYYEKDQGIIRIYINFPGISNYIINSKGDGTDNPIGRTLLYELIVEAFCKATAQIKVENEGSSLEGRLDSYLKEYNEIMKQCLPMIYKICVEDVNDKRKYQ